MIGETVFFQYVIYLPYASPDYDFTEGSDSYKLITKSYNIATQAVKSYDFDFVVSGDDWSFSSEDGALLHGYTIEDGILIGEEVVRYYDEDGKERIKLQEILPGANEVWTDSGYLLISNNVETKVYEGSKYLGSFPNAEYEFESGLLTKFVGDMEACFTLDGERIFLSKGDGYEVGDQQIADVERGKLYYVVVEEATDGLGDTVDVLYMRDRDGKVTRVASPYIYDSDFIIMEDSAKGTWNVYDRGKTQQLIVADVDPYSWQNLYGSYTLEYADTTVTYEIYTYMQTQGDVETIKYLLYTQTWSD